MMMSGSTDHACKFFFSRPCFRWWWLLIMREIGVVQRCLQFWLLASGGRRRISVCLSVYLSIYLSISCCCSWRKKDTLAEFFQVLTGELLTGESIESFIAFVVDAIRKMIYLLERCYYLHSLYFLHVCLSIKDRLLANFRSQTDRRS